MAPVLQLATKPESRSAHPFFGIDGTYPAVLAVVLELLENALGYQVCLSTWRVPEGVPDCILTCVASAIRTYTAGLKADNIDFHVLEFMGISAY
jgi:hypothetical protein